MDAAKALKPSLCLELEAIHANDMMGDDLLGEAAMVTGEDFSIDDLLDFSNEQLEEEEKDSLSVSSTDSADDDSNSNAASFLGNGEDSDLIFGSELAVPVEDIAEELEWLSQFVDDSFPLSPCHPSSPSYLILQPEPTSSTVHPSMPVSLNHPCFPSPFPVKIRSKRSRIPQPMSLSPSTCETSSTSSWSSSSPTVVDFLKTKKSLTRAVAFQRRCSHCLVQRTPQWRTGPLGPKTLCNACGVRYKSGRLFPEYRPACSPTFAVEIHSNSHRKVLEMRRKESGLVAIVSSC